MSKVYNHSACFSALFPDIWVHKGQVPDESFSNVYTAWRLLHLHLVWSKYWSFICSFRPIFRSPTCTIHPWADILHPPIVLNGLELVKPCPACAQCKLFLGLIVYLLHCFARSKLDCLPTLVLDSRLRNPSLLTINSIWSSPMSCPNWPVQHSDFIQVLYLLTKQTAVMWKHIEEKSISYSN